MEKPIQIRTPAVGLSATSRCPHVAPSIASLALEVQTAQSVWRHLQVLEECAFEAVRYHLQRHIEGGSGLSLDSTVRLQALMDDFESKRSIAMDRLVCKNDALKRLVLQLRNPMPSGWLV